MNLHNNMKGAGLMAGSMAGYAINDAFVKALVADMPIAQIVVLRGVLATVLVGFLAIRLRQFRFDFPRRDWWIIALRTAAEVGTTWFFVNALALMPLANLHAVLQALPLTVALGAALFLGEPLGWRRLLAIGIGFVGVMLIVRPGPEGFGLHTAYGLAAVGLITLRDLVSRKLSDDVPSLTVAWVNAVLVTLVFGVGAFAPGTEWVALDLRAGVLIAGAALAIFAGYLFSVMTMRVGDIGFSAPFRYTGLVWALVLGFVAFGDWPEPLTLLGAAIVVATGLFTLYRERVKALAAHPGRDEFDR